MTINATNEIKIGDYILITDKLKDELERLEFKIDIDSFCEEFVDTQQIVHQIWQDKDGEIYVTVDLCVEIPIAACKRLV